MKIFLFCYTKHIDKPFYASGFLYNLKSQQILLLQQKDDVTHNWSTLGGDGMEGENAQVTFQRIVRELLSIELQMKQIYPVYDYFHRTLDKINYVFYAEVKKSLDFNPLKDNISSWITFGETLKLLFSVYTKQDVVVGERVIRLKERQDEAGQLLHSGGNPAYLTISPNSEKVSFPQKSSQKL